MPNYDPYFLGAIIITEREGTKFIVDGQQRLTSLSLLLIYLRNQLRELGKSSSIIDPLIKSEKYGEESFNLGMFKDKDENKSDEDKLMEDIYNGQEPEVQGASDSFVNMVARYKDIEQSFPSDVNDEALLCFVDWLLEKVILVEITTESDGDAYTVFETMNDRGLSLTPTEMLKGFLLTKISNPQKRNEANDVWKKIIQNLNKDEEKEMEADCIKAWLRSQYATKIRERKREAIAENFDQIGTEFHRWLRNNSEEISLKGSDDFHRFIIKDFDFYSRQYLRLIEASEKLVKGLEHVFYINQYGFTLQHMLLLAPLSPDDKPEQVEMKMGLVAKFLDILLTWRLWHHKSIGYSTMLYSMAQLMFKIREHKEADKLAEFLKKELDARGEEMKGDSRAKQMIFSDKFSLTGQNRPHVHCILARITGYIETESGSGLKLGFAEYVNKKDKKKANSEKWEIEHIWANRYEDYQDEFAQASEFEDYRNRIGGLLLMPKKNNAGLGASSYTTKLAEYYRIGNLLAKSLHGECYNTKKKENKGFLRFREQSKLPFKEHPVFKKADLLARIKLYQKIAEKIWDPKSLMPVRKTKQAVQLRASTK